VSEHPLLALEHLAPFRTDLEIQKLSTKEEKDKAKAKGQKQGHQNNVLKHDWCALQSEYHKAFQRRYEALDGFKGAFEHGDTKFYRIDFHGRMATGLGNASVMENGLTLNRTYGLPMLGGTGLKGLASAMAHLGLEGDSWCSGTTERQQGSDHRALFGDRHAGEEGTTAGLVTFHDAWWDPEPEPGKKEQQLPFELDVLTPHQPGYNLDGRAWPNDWTDPVPCPFLTVKGTFRLALTGPPEWVDAAFEILKMAFQNLGFGAKTQIGYGRGDLKKFLSEEEKEEQAHQENARKAKAQRRDQVRCEKEAEEQEWLKAEKEAARMASLPQEVFRGVLKPLRIGGQLSTRLEVRGTVYTLDHEELRLKAGDAATGLWARLEAGKDAKVMVVLVTDGTKRVLLKLALPS
jgi:CRISPR-associated protein Cmr6